MDFHGLALRSRFGSTLVANCDPPPPPVGPPVSFWQPDVGGILSIASRNKIRLRVFLSPARVRQNFLEGGKNQQLFFWK